MRQTIDWRIAVCAVAALAALIHMTPYWHAQSQTPAGWTFTGNVNTSPDFMQYRVWERQTLQTGILVANKFTTEPNQPHLPVIFYFLIGQIARGTQLAPEIIFAYAGALFAFLLTVLLFFTIQKFIPSLHQAWWVLLVILFGGGLGAHLKIISNIPVLRDNILLRRTLIEGLWSWMVFEDYRSHYVFVTLFDTHFLLIWLLATAAVLALYITIKNFSWGWLGLTCFMFALSTLIHLYEGITLAVIASAVAFTLWRKTLLTRVHLITFGMAILAVALCLIAQLYLFNRSGLALPAWRAVNVLFATLLIAYPIAWGVIAWGGLKYWQHAGLAETFLVGWALGCTALTLSGPFYPYPDRGTMTLQIPIYIIAGQIFFARWPRMTPLIVGILILILGATPVTTFALQWKFTNFDPTRAAVFTSRAHREIVAVLTERAGENDVIILDKTDFDWGTDDLWIAPEYPGKFYAGHFFLTPDYDKKRAEVNRFFEGSPNDQAAFLREKRIRFVYVNANQNPHRFEQIPGLRLLKSEPIGALFEYATE